MWPRRCPVSSRRNSHSSKWPSGNLRPTANCPTTRLFIKPKKVHLAITKKGNRRTASSSPFMLTAVPVPGRWPPFPLDQVIYYTVNDFIQTRFVNLVRQFMSIDWYSQEYQSLEMQQFYTWRFFHSKLFKSIAIYVVNHSINNID